jgi:hypothetical protein
MSAELYYKVIAVGPLAPSEAVTIAHGLRHQGQGFRPNRVMPDGISPIAVVDVNATTVTFFNPTSALAPQVDFECEITFTTQRGIKTPSPDVMYWRGNAGGGGAGGYTTIQNPLGTSLPQEPILGLGADFAAVDDPGNTRTDVALAAIGPGGTTGGGGQIVESVTVDTKGRVTAASAIPDPLVGAANSPGGNLTLRSGSGGASNGAAAGGSGGAASLLAGSGGDGTPTQPAGPGGTVTINGGSAGANNGGGGASGGSVTVDAGAGSPSGTVIIGGTSASAVSIGRDAAMNVSLLGNTVLGGSVGRIVSFIGRVNTNIPFSVGPGISDIVPDATVAANASGRTLRLIGGAGGPNGTGGNANLISGSGGASNGAAAGGSGGAILVQSASGGAGSGVNAGGAGGLVQILGGVGGAGTATSAGGAGGNVQIIAGLAGTNNGGGTGVAGQVTVTAANGRAASGASAATIGGSIAITSGTGGTGSATAPAGLGGPLNIFGGNGGASVGNGAGGQGGTLSLGAGMGGAGSATTAGGQGGTGSLKSGDGGPGTATSSAGVGGQLNIAAGSGGGERRWGRRGRRRPGPHRRQRFRGERFRPGWTRRHLPDPGRHRRRWYCDGHGTNRRNAQRLWRQWRHK